MSHTQTCPPDRKANRKDNLANAGRTTASQAREMGSTPIIDKRRCSLSVRARSDVLPTLVANSKFSRRMPKELHCTPFRGKPSGFNSPPCRRPDGKRIRPFGCGAGPGLFLLPLSPGPYPSGSRLCELKTKKKWPCFANTAKSGLAFGWPRLSARQTCFRCVTRIVAEENTSIALLWCRPDLL